MTTRAERLSRIHIATDLMYRFQMRRVASLDNSIMNLAKIEAESLDHAFINIPYQLTISRLRLLEVDRLKLTEERAFEIARAQATGRKLKQISKLLVKIQQLS